MMRPIHNVVRGVQGLLWTPKKGGRLPLFGGTVRAGCALSRFASQPFRRSSSIAKSSLRVAHLAAFNPTGEAGATNLPNLFARHHKLIAALAMVAIWAAWALAIGRLK